MNTINLICALSFLTFISNTVFGDEKMTLMDAVSKGNVVLAEQLLQEGADINAVDEYKERTPLMVAASNGNAILVQLLLQEGANINAVAHRYNALNYALGELDFEIFDDGYVETDYDMMMNALQLSCY